MSDTGRHFIYVEGRTFCVEPIDNSQGKSKKWGDLDPASKKVTGHYGEKHIGAIHEDDSIITKENGYKNIEMLDAGVSPMGHILHLIEKEKAAKAAKVSK